MTWLASECCTVSRRSCSSRLRSAHSRWCCDSIGRQNDARFVLARTVEDCDVADALDQSAARLLGQLGEDAVALVAIADAGANLHQLVSTQCGFELAGDRRRQTALADEHDGFARVGEATQMLLLFLSQIRLHA